MVEFLKKLTSKDYDVLSKTHNKKAKTIIIIMCIFMFLLGLICFLADAFELGLFCVIFGLVYPFIVIFILKMTNKKSVKTTSIISNETDEHYIFDENKVEVITTKGNDFYSLIKTSYKYFYKAIETKDSFLLYISHNQAYVINKNDITVGTIEEFESYLSLNLKSNFIKK